MKKWLVIICALLAAVVICIYLLIPGTMVISRTVVAKCKADGAFPILREESNWSKWWPSDTAGLSFRITHLSYHIINIHIGEAGGRDTAGGYDSRLSVIPLGSVDSVLLQWDCVVVPGGMNPMRRVRRYLAAREMGNKMNEIMDSMSGYLGKKEHIYGVAIHEGSTTDNALLAIKAIFPAPPSTEDVYRLLHKVKDYLEKGGARQTGYPMMNVTPLNDRKDSFQVMVAIPVDRSLSGTSDIYFKRLVPGKYLIGDVKGGRHKIEEALAGFGQYILDYQRTVMAIPFESLITDRSLEPDTSRWVTRIYYPIF